MEYLKGGDMPQDVKIWEIQNNILKKIEKSKLPLEKYLEDWLEKDISIISEDLLVIGRQVETDFGKAIDLLCLNSNGDVVIVELKRDETSREVISQVLDYASWVKDLSYERIVEIANNYLCKNKRELHEDENLYKNGDLLESVFEDKFHKSLPDTINEHHKMLIVASYIDETTERIIDYLSETYGIDINAATFHYFENEEGKGFLVRVFLIEPQKVECRANRYNTSKRKPNLTYEELEKIAESNGVGELYKELVNGLTFLFDYKGTTRKSIAFIRAVDEGHRQIIFRIFPGESDSQRGLLFRVYIDRLAELFHVKPEEIMQILPPYCEECKSWTGGPRDICGYFKGKEEIDKFLKGLNQFKQK